MGYRTYIGKMPKREYNKIKSMTEEQLIDFYNIEVEGPDGIDDEGHWHKGPYEFDEKLYEFGKYTDFNPPKGSTSSFFKKKVLKERYEKEYELRVVTQDFLAYIIETYSEKVRTYYAEMLEPFYDEKGQAKEIIKLAKSGYDYTKHKEYNEFDPENISEAQNRAMLQCVNHIRSMATEWGVCCWFNYMRPYNLEQKEFVSASWKYEYAVFELVHIYNTFDWKKNVMIFYGY